MDAFLRLLRAWVLMLWFSQYAYAMHTGAGEMSGVCIDGVTSPFKACTACTVNAMPLAVDKGFFEFIRSMKQ
jgi:hypothetical protein